jgi:hypothetical protein
MRFNVLSDFGDSSPETSLMHADGTMPKPDFSGWATKANLQCSDGRTILTDAFKHQDKMQVPLVWQHGHSNPGNVLGYAILEHREEGVYTYGYFNDSDSGKNAKTLVLHEDIKALSIFANKLVEKAKQVSHGVIREVSLVLAGANPGALIDNIELQHADGDVVTIDDEAIIYTGETLKHEEDAGNKETETEDETVQDVYDDMTDEQKGVVHYLVGAALENKAAPSGDKTEVAQSGTTTTQENITHDKGGRTMKRNIFEQQNPAGDDEKHELSHDDVKGIAADAVKRGSLKSAVEAYALEHGINDIDTLFPDAKTITSTPEWDARRMEWVKSVLNGTRHSPFSRIKSIVADITIDQARALGYIKGNLKKEEFFGLTKRITTPTTIYKKQQLDRDDIIDITDFDVVTWLKGEMRLMLDEELARAVLIGDGRPAADPANAANPNPDKIRDPAGAVDGAGIRSILRDHDLYAAKVNIEDGMALLDSDPSAVVDAILLQMGQYKGSGQPTFYTTLPVLTKLLLARDAMGRRLYRTASDLAAELTVSSVVAVEVMETNANLLGIIVNLQDYTVGADRGGDISMFDDFDIDYNQYKYLIETRVSGGLTKIRSALVVNSVNLVP